MKKTNKNKAKSYVDIMKEAGEKYGVKVTDLSEQGTRAIGVVGGLRWPKPAALTRPFAEDNDRKCDGDK
jgi:hypothetical protein